MKILIVDDEKPARDHLIRLANKVIKPTQIDEADCGLVAIDKIASGSYDLVFMDMKMPDLTGLQVAAACASFKPLIVFVTAFDQYAFDAFEVNALDYLLKPVEEARFAKTVDKVLKHLEAQKENTGALLDTQSSSGDLDFFVAKIDGNFQVFENEEVAFLSASGNYVTIHVADKNFICSEALDSLETRLKSDVFFRCHRAHVVNKKFIQKINRLGDRKLELILKNPQLSRIPVGRTYIDELKAWFNIGSF